MPALANPWPRACLWQCNNNRIAHWAEVEHLASLPRLQTVYLEGNPIAQDVRYRARVKLLLPRLIQIDALPARV
jgi:protein phosphatase 1 regulatory subunit 7